MRGDQPLKTTGLLASSCRSFFLAKDAENELSSRSLRRGEMPICDQTADEKVLPRSDPADGCVGSPRHPSHIQIDRDVLQLRTLQLLDGAAVAGPGGVKAGSAWALRIRPAPDLHRVTSASLDTQPLGCRVVGDDLSQHPVHKVDVLPHVLGQEDIHALLDRDVQRQELLVDFQPALAVVVGGVGFQVARQTGDQRRAAAKESCQGTGVDFLRAYPRARNNGCGRVRVEQPPHAFHRWLTGGRPGLALLQAPQRGRVGLGRPQLLK